MNVGEAWDYISFKVHIQFSSHRKARKSPGRERDLVLLSPKSWKLNGDIWHSQDVTLFINLPSKWTLTAQHKRPCSLVYSRYSATLTTGGFKVASTRWQNNSVRCRKWPRHSPILWCCRGPTEMFSQSLGELMLTWSWGRQVGSHLCSSWTLTVRLQAVSLCLKRHRSQQRKGWGQSGVETPGQGGRCGGTLGGVTKRHGQEELGLLSWERRCPESTRVQEKISSKSPAW